MATPDPYRCGMTGIIPTLAQAHAAARRLLRLPEPHPCGHLRRTPGCGGCDPGAIETVIEDDGTRRPFDPTRDLSPRHHTQTLAHTLTAINLTTDPCPHAHTLTGPATLITTDGQVVGHFDHPLTTCLDCGTIIGTTQTVTPQPQVDTTNTTQEK